MSQQQRICPECQTLLVPEAIFCPKCGTKYAEQPVLTQVPVSQQLPQQPAYAAATPEWKEPGIASEPKPKSSGKLGVAILVVLVLMVFVIGWATDYNSQGNRYERACTALENGNYTEAISLFEELDDYLNSEEKLIQAKYKYVQANFYQHNTKTYTYLTELKDASYLNSEALYYDLYAWKLEVVAVNSDPDDTTTNKSSVSRNSPLYFHLRLQGGEPGASTTLRVQYTLPGGSTGSYTFNSPWSAGTQTGWYGWEDGLGGSTGTLYMFFYDDDNNLLTSHAVYISS